MNKKTIIIIIIVMVLFAFFLGSRYQVQKEAERKRSFDDGYASATAGIIQAARTCQAITLVTGNQSATIISVACLQ